MEITLENVLAVLRKYIVIILVVALVAGIGAYLVSRFMIAPTYVSTATLNLVVPPEQLKSFTESSSAWVYANRQVLTCVELLESNSFKANVRENAVIDHYPNFTVSYNENSTVITIKAMDNDRDDAYKIAMTAAERASDFVRDKNVSMLALVIVDTPEVAKSQTAPRPLRNVLIAALAAAVLIFVIELLRETIGTRIKDENELARHYEYPVIAVIPDFNDVARKGSYYYDYHSYSRKAEDENGEK